MDHYSFIRYVVRVIAVIEHSQKCRDPNLWTPITLQYIGDMQCRCVIDHRYSVVRWRFRQDIFGPRVEQIRELSESEKGGPDRIIFVLGRRVVP